MSEQRKGADVGATMRKILRSNPRDFAAVRLVCTDQGFVAFIMPTSDCALRLVRHDMATGGKVSTSLDEFTTALAQRQDKPLPPRGTGRTPEEALAFLAAEAAIWTHHRGE